MKAIRITCLAAALAALAGCNADERGRVVKLEKGVYQGAPDTSLSAISALAPKRWRPGPHRWLCPRAPTFPWTAAPPARIFRRAT